MIEEWRDIRDYEGIYQISNFGRLRSLDREICITEKSGRAYKYLKRGRIISPGICRGYLNTTLCNGDMRKTQYVHRLVASAFLPNPENLPEINHKDRNPLNNRVENLEWCSRYYNTHYDGAIERQHATIRKKVRQRTLDGKIVAEFPSVCDASKQTGVHKSLIAKVANGMFKQGKSFIWEFIT